MDDKDVIISELRALVADLAARIEAQAARIAELELALAKAKKDSTTSSKPPSSDITKPQPKKTPGRRKKRKQGGQPGHERQLREPLPPERFDTCCVRGESGQKVLPLDLQGVVHEVVQPFLILKRQIAFKNHSIKTVRTGYNALVKLGNKTRSEFHGVLQRLAV